MTPKSLLRHPRAGSSLADLSEGRFQRVIDDPTGRARSEEVTRLVLCTGKVYIDLLGALPTLRQAQGAPSGAAPDNGMPPNVAVARVEELYSFPADELRAVIAGYPVLRELIWLQEEPRNMGAWNYIAPQLREVVDPAIPISYVGRPDSASPAEGSLSLHTVEQARIIAEALHSSALVPATR